MGRKPFFLPFPLFFLLIVTCQQPGNFQTKRSYRNAPPTRSQIKGTTRPAGSQNESYFHANWGSDPGTMNDWLVAPPGPGAFSLETLKRLKDWEKLSFKNLKIGM